MSPAAGWRGLVGADRAQVAIGNRAIVLLKAPSLADKLAAAGGFGTEGQMREWSAAAVSAQKQFAAKIAGKGLPLVPEHVYTRVVNGFSTALDPRGVALLERDPEVRGVYPIRAAYPASLSSRALGQTTASLSPGPTLAGFDGKGLTVAVLDTGIDSTHPFLRGRVDEGFDIVSPEGVAAPQKHPRLPAEIERHGTQLAGIVAGSGGPGGLRGVAPAARILPIRVAGWQPEVGGGYAIYGRTDQVLAGIERAVDPNGDGSVLDAARIALVGVAEPFAAFPFERARPGGRGCGHAGHARRRPGRERRTRGTGLREHRRTGRRSRRARGRRRRRPRRRRNGAGADARRPPRPARPAAAARRRRRPGATP